MAEEQDLGEQELNAMLDRLIRGKAPDEILGQTGVVGDLTRRLVECVLDGEMTAHLGYEKQAVAGRDGGNSRNGKSRKRVKTDAAEIDIEVPRDRDGTFDPVMVAKGQRRLPGFDEKVIALYARGMTTREIQGDGCRIGGRARMAGARARGRPSDRVPRRDPCEAAHGRRRPEPGGLLIANPPPDEELCAGRHVAG
jgi:hypothetical protein